MTALPDVEWITTRVPLTWTCDGLCRSAKFVSGYSQGSFLDGCHVPLGQQSYFGWIQQESTFWKRSLWQKVYIAVRVSKSMDSILSKKWGCGAFRSNDAQERKR